MNAARVFESHTPFERCFLHGLALEWESARDFLPETYGRGLRRPVFRLSDMESRWGLWNAERREIVISRRLVLQHSWYAVREVLLHEMAHQLAQEVLEGDQETPHGPMFLEACRLLRARPEASGHFDPLGNHAVTNGPGLHPKDRILLRARKLLALAESGNRHEAAAAMGKAQELMEKYNLDLVAARPDRSFQSCFLGKPGLRHGIETSLLANLLQDFYFISAVWVPVYVVDRGRMGRALEVSGTPENLRMAAYVFEFVNRYIEDQWAPYRGKSRSGGGRKGEFATGVIDGFRDRLEAGRSTRKEGKQKGGRALLRLKDPLLKRYVAERYPFIRTSGRRLRLGNEEARRRGLEKGRNLVLYRPLESDSASGAPPLLTAD